MGPIILNSLFHCPPHSLPCHAALGLRLQARDFRHNIDAKHRPLCWPQRLITALLTGSSRLPQDVLDFRLHLHQRWRPCSNLPLPSLLILRKKAHLLRLTLSRQVQVTVCLRKVLLICQFDHSWCCCTRSWRPSATSLLPAFLWLQETAPALPIRRLRRSCRAVRRRLNKGWLHESLLNERKKGAVPGLRLCQALWDCHLYLCGYLNLIINTRQVSVCSGSTLRSRPPWRDRGRGTASLGSLPHPASSISNRQSLKISIIRICIPSKERDNSLGENSRSRMNREQGHSNAPRMASCLAVFSVVGTLPALLTSLSTKVSSPSTFITPVFYWYVLV